MLRPMTETTSVVSLRRFSSQKTVVTVLEPLANSVLSFWLCPSSETTAPTSIRSLSPCKSLHDMLRKSLVSYGPSSELASTSPLQSQDTRSSKVCWRISCWSSATGSPSTKELLSRSTSSSGRGLRDMLLSITTNRTTYLQVLLRLELSASVCWARRWGWLKLGSLVSL